MSDRVEEFFNSPIPDPIWHYTSLAGLEGILSSGTVWATEAHYTTDASEFVHAKAVAVAFLEKIEPADENMARAKQAGLETLIHAFDTGPLSPEKTEVFVASFSSSSDLKSQWIEYADGGRGVSIAFNLTKIRPPREIESAVTFAPCVYAQEEKEKLLEAALSHFIETVAELYRKTTSRKWVAAEFRRWVQLHRVQSRSFDRASFEAALNGRIHEQLHRALTRTSFDLLRIASHCKDNSFHQEGEWRLSLPHTKGKALKGIEIQYRGAQKAIPYLPHNLFQQKLPITQVLCGPLCQDVAQVQALLDRYRYQVPLAKSEIPIRSALEIR
jgi:hypothetical protein